MSKNLKKTILVAFDVLCYVVAWILSVVILRGDLKAVLINNWVYLLIGVGVFIALNFAFKVYSILLRYAGVSAALKIFAVSVLMLCYNGLVCLLSERLVIEWAIILNCAIFSTTVASRFFYRVKENLLSSKHVKGADCVRVMVVGAGNAGNTLINEMRTSSKLNMNPVCALDDDEDKINKYSAGVKLVGKIAEAQAAQQEANRMIRVLCRVGVMAGEKEILCQLGLDFGQCRRPFAPLGEEARALIKKEILPFVTPIA